MAGALMGGSQPLSVTHVSPRYSNIYTARLQTVNMRCDLRHPFRFSHRSPATDPEAAPVANPRRAPRVRTIWSEYVPSEQAREIGDNRGARCVLALDVDPPPPPLSPDDAALASAMVSLSIHNTLADLATRVDSIALSDEPAPAPRGGGPRPPGGPFGAPPGGDPSGEAGLPRAGSPQPTPPAARAAGHIERFIRVAHSSQPRAADSFCAPTAAW